MKNNKINLESEKEYLDNVLDEIETQIKETNSSISGLKKEKSELSKHFAEEYYSMDDEEALQESDDLIKFDQLIEFYEKLYDRLIRQKYSPYFGRVDFKESGDESSNSFYIGVNNLTKNGKELPLVCDWRAPVSSLFYDFEIGKASYESEGGLFEGEISVKRQYKIEDGELKSAFNSSLNIGDEILKGVLSGNASSKMKTIITSIQKEQNKIIRTNITKNLLVQGVAGSGKTSIALHRIAYLLYNKKNLKAEDVLILSPNKIFSEYISDVLPELGEENVPQISFYEFAKDIIKDFKISVQKREQNIEDICNDISNLNVVAYKNTYEFYESLKQFCSVYFDLSFNPTDLKFGPHTIKGETLKKLYSETYKSKSPAIRINWLVDYIIDELNITKAVKEISEKIKKMLYPFFVDNNILNIYSNFLGNIGLSLKLTENGELKYEDVGAVLYIINEYFGILKQQNVKYLIIDEMQDYSFVIYDILEKIYPCQKIVLGDINQCIEKVMTYDDLLKLQKLLNAELMELNNAYRSTYEITTFCNQIKQINSVPLSRHGAEPEVIKTDNLNESVKEIINKHKNRKSFAIITKSIKQAKDVYAKLYDIDELTLNIDYFGKVGNICVMPSFLAKGLEFDVVIVADYNESNFANNFDKNLLYVSCTRALHELYLI